MILAICKSYAVRCLSVAKHQLDIQPEALRRH